MGFLIRGGEERVCYQMQRAQRKRYGGLSQPTRDNKRGDLVVILTRKKNTK